MKVGFTGTQQGMTNNQKAMVIGLLSKEKPEIAHHGGCIGADTEFDDICYRFLPRHIITVVHPSNIFGKRGRWHPTNYTRGVKPSLERNKNIVDESDFIIATPKETAEVLRSGTWATIRYARKTGKHLYTVYPNNTYKEENK